VLRSASSTNLCSGVRGPRAIATGTPLLLACLAVLYAPPLRAQSKAQQQQSQQQQSQLPNLGPTPDVTDPVAALSSALAASCRHDVSEFAQYLTSSNAAAFRALEAPQQIGLLRRMVQLEDSGQPLLSADAQGRSVLRCDTPSIAGEFRLGAARMEDNFAFVSVDLNRERKVDFGMLRTSAGWKVFSVGLLVLDVPQLTAEWAQEDLQTREQTAIDALRTIAQALDTYYHAFQKLPDLLNQLGPAPKSGISPERAGLLDETLANSQVQGYAIRYRIVPNNPDQPPVYELAATPQQYGKSGVRSFFLDSTGKLRGGDKHGQPATVADPVIESTPSTDQ
jgi:hypothetical protein